MEQSEVFERLWSEHSAAVLRYALRRVPSSQVDDVVAETFVVVWRRLADVPEPALPWLLGVARGVAANHARSQNRQTALAVRLASQPVSANPATSTDRTDMVAAALDLLSDDDRELLTLIAWDGLEPREAAQVLGCSSATVRVRLHRARARLREALDSSVNSGRDAR